ncbi:MAG: DUF4199 domain-containing protein [Bacteroidales bacterium]|nr:DUF4199 domain-containing protein [Bacteroidales bacterium]
MLNDNNFWKIHLKWGIIAGIMLAGIEILKMFARKVDYQSAQLLDLAMIVGFILVLHYGVKEFKEVYPERLSFAKAYFSCIVISLVGAAILFGYDLLHYSFIEKDGLEKKYVIALEKYKQNLAKDTLKNAELMAYTDAAVQLMQAQKDSLLTRESLNDTLCNEISSGTLIIQNFYTGKLRSKPEADKEQYQLGNFTPYAKRVLMETLTSYIEQNDGKASTPFVQSLVQKTNEELPSIDPLEKRYEENKSHVPRYDKNGQYAAVSAMMYLLYGMFFGLFVAMFHYKSKNPIEAAADTPEQ